MDCQINAPFQSVGDHWGSFSSPQMFYRAMDADQISLMQSMANKNCVKGCSSTPCSTASLFAGDEELEQLRLYDSATKSFSLESTKALKGKAARIVSDAEQMPGVPRRALYARGSAIEEKKNSITQKVEDICIHSKRPATPPSQILVGPFSDKTYVTPVKPKQGDENKLIILHAYDEIGISPIYSTTLNYGESTKLNLGRSKGRVVVLQASVPIVATAFIRTPPTDQNKTWCQNYEASVLQNPNKMGGEFVMPKDNTEATLNILRGRTSTGESTRFLDTAANQFDDDGNKIKSEVPSRLVLSNLQDEDVRQVSSVIVIIYLFFV